MLGELQTLNSLGGSYSYTWDIITLPVLVWTSCPAWMEVWSMIRVSLHPHGKNKYSWERELSIWKCGSVKRTLVFYNYMSMGLASKQTARKSKKPDLHCFTCCTRDTVSVSPTEECGVYNWCIGRSLGLWQVLWAWTWTWPAVNFVNLDNLLVSVSLRGRIYWSETHWLYLFIGLL